VRAKLQTRNDSDILKQHKLTIKTDKNKQQIKLVTLNEQTNKAMIKLLANEYAEQHRIDDYKLPTGGLNNRLIRLQPTICEF